MSVGRALAVQPHHEWLELESVKALARGDALTALDYADRRCRISPPPLAHSHVLRGEALFRAGDRSGAIDAINQALALAPEDIAANRRMLAWATGDARRDAASVLIRADRDIATLRRAIEALRADGRRNFASWEVFEDVIDGWALWEGDGPAMMTINDGAGDVTILLRGAPCADFPAMGAWRRFRVRRPQSSQPQSILITAAGEIIHSQRTRSLSPVRLAPSASPDVVAAGPTAIVPIYGDFDATRACLECLLDELKIEPGMQAILVNDASPDPRIVDLMSDIARTPGVRVLNNAQNLGFVGAVNRALEDIADGDVVLLNADVLLPPGFVARLAEAARSAPDIGLVMPLSNNGDLASFPTPFVASPVGSRASIEAVDRIASQTNRERVVDIPNGIGFCLYITRSCLAAIGGLSGDFDRGYLEDVDLSLRARALGFRTVCAPSVFVGHAGSKSFGSAKRALVVRNASIIHSRYPRYSLEFVAFAAADPLREARQAIQWRMPLGLSQSRLIVAGVGAVGEVARARARRLVGRESVLVLSARNRAEGWRVVLTSACENDALAAEFDLSSRAQCEALVALLGEASVARIELLDPLAIPFQLVDLLRELNTPYDIVIADAGLLGRERASRMFAVNRSSLDPHILGRAGDKAWVKRWRTIVKGADKVWAIDRRAQAFAANIFPQRETPELLESGEAATRPAPPCVSREARRIGLMPIRSTASEQILIEAVAAALFKTAPDLRLIVIGATLDDVALMRRPNVHVTGPIDSETLETVATTYALDRLFACATQPLFGHPLLSAAFEGSRPLAYVDWTGGAVAPRRHDLALDPSSSLESLIGRLRGWVESDAGRSVRD